MNASRDFTPKCNPSVADDKHMHSRQTCTPTAAFARWLTSCAIACCAAALLLASLRAAAAAAGQITVAGRSLPHHSPAYEATRRVLPNDFRSYESRSFAVLSNEHARWTQVQLGRLEAAHREFHRFTASLALHPAPLRHKLVCVLFHEKRDFVGFAASQDNLSSSWSLGYYSPRTDRIVFYNGQNQENADEFAAKRVIATTIHEAVHQLSFHTGIQTIHVQYPLWINEGLATSFETDCPDRAFGPDHDFPPRRDRFNTLLAEKRLIPLRVLAQLDAMPDDRQETVFTVYNESYAFFSWIARHRKPQLRDYLDLMLKEPPGRPAGQRHLELFEQAFGDADRLQDAWLRDERRQLACTSSPVRRQRWLPSPKLPGSLPATRRTACPSADRLAAAPADVPLLFHLDRQNTSRDPHQHLLTHLGAAP